jgi:glucokinase
MPSNRVRRRSVGRARPTRRIRGGSQREFCIGVDLGGTKIATGLVDASGRIRRPHMHPTGSDRPADRIIADIADCLRNCWGEDLPRVRAVGVGVAGQVEPDGTVAFAPNLRWRNVPLAREIRKIVRRPVCVLNDVRAITFGVWKHGAGRGVDDLVCIFIGTGLGGGIVTEGTLRTGANGTAGELGHTTVVAGGRKCHCPNRGCWEAYVGGWAIAERTREAAAADPSAAATILARSGGTIDSIDAHHVHEAYQEGDPLAIRIVDETVRYVIDGLVSVVNSIDPELIVLGGGVMGGLAMFLDDIRAGVRARALPTAARGLRIVPAKLGEYSGVLGSATYAFEQLRHPERS